MRLTTVTTGATGTKSTLVWGMRPAHLALLGVVLLTFFRLWYVRCVDLVPDEAYFWVWSKHFALSYRDKGPLVAWTIAVGTHLFGDTVFGAAFLRSCSAPEPHFNCFGWPSDCTTIAPHFGVWASRESSQCSRLDPF